MHAVSRLIGTYALVGLLVTLGGCQKKPESIIANVGSYSLSQNEVHKRDQVNRVYNPQDERSVGQYQLTEAFIYAEILRKYNQPITIEVLEKEAARIDKATLFPDKLFRIKNIFSSREEYLKLYVLPIYAGRVVYYELFLQNPTIQANAFKVPQQFLEKVKAKPESFAKFAQKEGKKVANFSVSLSEGVMWRMPEDQSGEKINASSTANVPVAVQRNLAAARTAGGEKWIEGILKNLKPGEVVPRPVDNGETWLVVRYLGRSKGHYECQAVSFPKENYSKWLEREKKLIKVSKNTERKGSN